MFGHEDDPEEEYICTFEEYRNVYLNTRYIIVPGQDDEEVVSLVLGDFEFYDNNTAKIIREMAEGYVDMIYETDYTSHIVSSVYGIDIVASMDGRNIYFMNLSSGEILETFWSIDATYPVIYKQYYLTYDYGYRKENVAGVFKYQVFARDKSNTSYENILTQIDGIPVTSIYTAFKDNTVMETAPTIPSSITDISRAFYGCTALTSVTIPTSVTDISGAFYGCTNLHTVNYLGTIEQWNAIDSKNEWNTDSGITKVTCSDGDIEISSN